MRSVRVREAGPTPGPKNHRELMKILDSDHCVYILRGRLDIDQVVESGERLAVTAISVGELSYGAHRSARADENLARLHVLLSALPVLPFDEGAGRRFGSIKAQLMSAGTPVSDPDLQIASIALDLGAPLITHNRRHFEPVLGLEIEDWMD